MMLPTSVCVPPLHSRTAKYRARTSQATAIHRIEKDLPIKQRKLWSEDAMAKAVVAVQSGQCSIRRAAEQYNVPR